MAGNNLDGWRVLPSGVRAVLIVIVAIGIVFAVAGIAVSAGSSSDGGNPCESAWRNSTARDIGADHGAYIARCEKGIRDIHGD